MTALKFCKVMQENLEGERKQWKKKPVNPKSKVSKLHAPSRDGGATKMF
jgi:hypothetical protein